LVIRYGYRIIFFSISTLVRELPDPLEAELTAFSLTNLHSFNIERKNIVLEIEDLRKEYRTYPIKSSPLIIYTLITLTILIVKSKPPVPFNAIV